MRYQHWTLQNVFVRVAEEWVYGLTYFPWTHSWPGWKSPQVPTWPSGPSQVSVPYCVMSRLRSLLVNTVDQIETRLRNYLPEIFSEKNVTGRHKVTVPNKITPNPPSVWRSIKSSSLMQIKIQQYAPHSHQSEGHIFKMSTNNKFWDTGRERK